MKKLLSILGAAGLVVSTSAVLVSCGGDKDDVKTAREQLTEAIAIAKEASVAPILNNKQETIEAQNAIKTLITEAQKVLDKGQTSSLFSDEENESGEEEGGVKPDEPEVEVSTDKEMLDEVTKLNDAVKLFNDLNVAEQDKLIIEDDVTIIEMDKNDELVLTKDNLNGDFDSVKLKEVSNSEFTIENVNETVVIKTTEKFGTKANSYKLHINGVKGDVNTEFGFFIAVK